MQISSSVRVLGNRHFNVYLAGAEEKAVIEGGVSGVIPVLSRQINEMQAGGVTRLVVMHAHFDHVCGLPGLRGLFPAARAAASAKAAAVLAKPSVVSGFFREDEAMTATLKDLDGDDGRPEPGGGFIPPATLPVDEIIPEETVWRLGSNFSLRFSPAPGHSPCSLMAYSPEEEVLFSSDSAGFPVDGRMVFPIFFDGYHAYVQTIRKMLDLPVKVLAGAHEEIITGRPRVRECLLRALDWAESTRAMVSEADGGGADREQLAGELFSRFYRGRLRMYTAENIMICCRLIVKRSVEAGEGSAGP